MTRGPHAARYTICCHDVDEAAAVRAALQVEVDDPLGGATVSLLDVAGASESFVLQVDADDLVHLRAASRSYLHWAQAATRSLRGAGAAAAASD